MLDLRAGALRVGGVYVGMRSLYVSVGDVRGRLLGSDLAPRPTAASAIAHAAATMMRRLCERADVSIRSLIGIGLAVVPEVADASSQADDEVFRRTLAVELKKELDRPAEVENAAVAMLVAEGLFGAVGDDRSLLVHVGTTVLAGVQWGHRLLGRFGYWAAPIGHTLIDPAGSVCVCGATGCLDTVASEPAIVRGAERALAAGERSSLTLAAVDRDRSRAIGEAASRGDPLAVRLVRDAANALAISAANSLTVLNGELAIVAGPIVAAGDALVSPLREGIASHMRTTSSGAPRVIASTFSLNEPFMAGVAVALDRFVFSGSGKSEYKPARPLRSPRRLALAHRPETEKSSQMF
jgi:predicted NBD/HSP70 family sugar kinase